MKDMWFGKIAGDHTASDGKATKKKPLDMGQVRPGGLNGDEELL